MGMTLTNFSTAQSQSPRMRAATVAAGVAGVLDQEVADELDVLGLAERLEVDHLEVAALAEVAVLVEDEGDAAAHAGGEVAAGRAEDDGDAAGHVLAAVVAGALDDGHARRCCGRRSARRPRPRKKAWPPVAP